MEFWLERVLILVGSRGEMLPKAKSGYRENCPWRFLKLPIKYSSHMQYRLGALFTNNLYTVSCLKGDLLNSKFAVLLLYSCVFEFVCHMLV